MEAISLDEVALSFPDIIRKDPQEEQQSASSQNITQQPAHKKLSLSLQAIPWTPSQSINFTLDSHQFIKLREAVCLIARMILEASSTLMNVLPISVENLLGKFTYPSGERGYSPTMPSHYAFWLITAKEQERLLPICITSYVY